MVGQRGHVAKSFSQELTVPGISPKTPATSKSTNVSTPLSIGELLSFMLPDSASESSASGSDEDPETPKPREIVARQEVKQEMCRRWAPVRVSSPRVTSLPGQCSSPVRSISGASPIHAPQKVFWKEGASGSPQVTKGAFTSELNLASMYEFAAPGFRGTCSVLRSKPVYGQAAKGGARPQGTWSFPKEALNEELQRVLAQLRSLEAHERSTALQRFLDELQSRAQRELSNWRGPFLSKEDRFPYWQHNVSRQTSRTSPQSEWEDQLQSSQRTLCRELSLELPHCRGSEFKEAARKVLAVQHFRRMMEFPQRSYLKDQDLPASVIEQIDLDIPRTAGNEPELRSCLGVTRALLLRQAAEDPELGYCQGMNMVAALFAVAAQTPEEAFTRFRGFVSKFRGLWQPGFPLLQQGMGIFETLAADRPWFQHLNRNGVEADMYLPRAWLGLFTSWLPLATRVILLRDFEEGDLQSIMAVTMAVLDHVGSSLLAEGDDMDELLKVLEHIKESPPHPAALITARDAWLPAVSARRSRKSCWQSLRRDGSRVLDGHGREALFWDFRPRRLSAIAGRALLRFSLKDFGRHH
ncbi:unnamed protein product [Effrenium voratum]|nr:unnamed protein product [Effrenium voratum]